MRGRWGSSVSVVGAAASSRAPPPPRRRRPVQGRQGDELAPSQVGGQGQPRDRRPFPGPRRRRLLGRPAGRGHYVEECPARPGQGTPGPEAAAGRARRRRRSGRRRAARPRSASARPRRRGGRRRPPGGARSRASSTCSRRSASEIPGQETARLARSRRLHLPCQPQRRLFRQRPARARRPYASYLAQFVPIASPRRPGEHCRQRAPACSAAAGPDLRCSAPRRSAPASRSRRWRRSDPAGLCWPIAPRAPFR